MRKYRRMLLLALLTLLFVVPNGNALDMSCFPGRYVHYVNNTWGCELNDTASDCILCYAVITVQG